MPDLKTHTEAITTATFNLIASFDDKANLQKAYKDILFHKDEGTLDLFLLASPLKNEASNLQRSISALTFLAESGKTKHIETLTDILSQDFVLDALKTKKHFYEPTGWLVKTLNEEQVERVLSADNTLWGTYDKAKYKDHIDMVKEFDECHDDKTLVDAYLDPKHVCYAMESMRVIPAEQKIDCEIA